MPEMTFKPVERCNLCHGSDFHRLFPARDRLYGVPGDFTILKCRTCGLWMCDPRPVGETLSLYYPSDYNPYSSIPFGPTGWRARLRSLALLRPVYALRDSVREFFENQKLPSFISSSLTPDSLLVDVGCGSGAFLDKARARYGCRVMGVDFSSFAAKTVNEVYGIPVLVGSFTEIGMEPGSVDVLTGWWYLEHDPNPTAVLARAWDVIKPGGHLVFGVPNHRSVVARLFGRNWYGLEAPRHLYLFSPATLRRYLEEAGFEVIDFYHDRTPWHLLGSLEFVFKPGRTFVPSWPWVRWLRLLFTPLTLLISLLHLSDAIVVRAKKPAASR